MSWIAGLLWVLFAALIVVGGGVSLEACGVWPWNVDACPRPAPMTQGELATQRYADLRNERDRLLQDANLAPQCQIPAPQDEPAGEDHAALCQPRLTSEVLLLVDASLSMKWDFQADQTAIGRLDQLDEIARRSNGLVPMALANEYDRIVAALDSAPGKDRIDVAKDALIELGRVTPEGTDFKLLSFASCNRPPVQEGVFDSGRNPDFVSTVRGLRLRSSTALAQAISSLPEFTSGGRTEDDPVNIVILTDGEDNCGGDPCAAAARLKAALPYAEVAVISVAKEANDNACVAEQSGGTFYYADDVAKVADLMRQATGQLSADECAALSTGTGPNPDSDGGQSE